MDLTIAAKYPFSSDAKDYVKQLVEEGWSISDYIIEKAAERVQKAFDNKLNFFIERDDIEKEEVLGYAISKMMLAAINDPYIRAKYSVGEAKRAFAYLAKDEARTVERISKELGLEFGRAENGEGYLLHFIPFMQNQPGTPEYLLINRDVKKGYVRLSEHERDRIVEEAIRRHIEIPPTSKNIPPQVAAAAEQLKNKLPKPIRKEIMGVGDIPPCIDAMLNDMHAHKNLPHTGRVYLTMYLHKIGWTDDALLELFSNSPDFNIRIAEYQIKYLSSHNYNVPNCSTVQSYGLCVANCGTKSPLQFRKSGKINIDKTADKDKKVETGRKVEKSG